jgi:uncharacterized protein (TIGR02266 family)
VVPNGRLDGLMLEGKLPARLGELVHLQVRFAEPAKRNFDVRVRLAWVRHKGNAALKEGYGVEFVPEDQAGRDRLLSFARQEVPLEGSRFDERISAALAVRIAHNGQERKEMVWDISQGGAFIQTGMFVPVGSLLELKLRPPGSLTRLKLKGRVAWLRKSGEARGFGVEFLFDNARQSARVLKILNRLRG